MQAARWRPLTTAALLPAPRRSFGSIMSLPRPPIGCERAPVDLIDYGRSSEPILRIFLFHALMQMPQIRLAKSALIAR